MPRLDGAQGMCMPSPFGLPPGRWTAQVVGAVRQAAASPDYSRLWGIVLEWAPCCRATAPAAHRLSGARHAALRLPFLVVAASRAPGGAADAVAGGAADGAGGRVAAPGHGRRGA